MNRLFFAPVLFLTLACGDNGSGETTAETDAATDASTDAPATDTDPPATDSSSGDEPTPTTGDSESSGGAESSTGGVDLSQFYDCEEKMFGAAPLAGPLFDAANGGIQGELQPSYFIHTTQIYIKAESAQQFIELAQKVSEEALKTEGLIGFSVGSDNGCGVARTLGIWADEASIYKLVASKPHADAMALTTELSYTGRTTHWSATAEEANALTWDVARAKLVDVEPSPIY